MKRLLIVLLASGLLMAFTGPVGAGPPCDSPPCDKPPSSPGGGTCSEAYGTDPKILLGAHDFNAGNALEFMLTKDQNAACFDTLAPAGKRLCTDGKNYLCSKWIVTVNGSEPPREMNVMIRDSAPGDFCGDDGYQVRQRDAVFETWVFPGVPESDWDACGTGFVEGTYPKDKPLVFWLNARNLPKTGELAITVTVSPDPDQ